MGNRHSSSSKIMKSHRELSMRVLSGEIGGKYWLFLWSKWTPSNFAWFTYLLRLRFLIDSVWSVCRINCFIFIFHKVSLNLLSYMNVRELNVPLLGWVPLEVNNERPWRAFLLLWYCSCFSWAMIMAYKWDQMVPEVKSVSLCGFPTNHTF